MELFHFGITQIFLAIIVLYFVNKFYQNSQKNKLAKKRLHSGIKVVVTGAARGVGRHLALEYAKHGAKLLIVDILAEPLEETKKMCLEEGASQVETLVSDLTVKDNCKGMLDKGVQVMDGIDIVFLNHVYATIRKIEDLKLEEIEKVIHTGLLSYIYCAHYAIPILKKSKGTLAVMSSMIGKFPMSYFGPYSCVKHGLEGFFSTLAVEMKPHEVQVSIVWPGTVRTEAISELAKTVDALKTAADPKVVAKQVVEGVAGGDRHIYPDPALKFLAQLRIFFPSLIEKLLESNSGAWEKVSKSLP